MRVLLSTIGSRGDVQPLVALGVQLKALGHGILVCDPAEMADVPIQLTVQRASATIFDGEASTSTMKRTLDDLAEFLTRELAFPHGVFLMTGTCLVPGDDFTLQVDDVVTVLVGPLTLTNRVAA